MQKGKTFAKKTLPAQRRKRSGFSVCKVEATEVPGIQHVISLQLNIYLCPACCTPVSPANYIFIGWLQQPQQRLTTQSVTCTLWVVLAVPAQSSSSSTTRVLSSGSHAAWLLSSSTSVSCLARWSSSAASQCFSPSLPPVLPYCVSLWLAHHDKHSTRYERQRWQPRLPATKMRCETSAQGKLGLGFVGRATLLTPFFFTVWCLNP